MIPLAPFALALNNVPRVQRTLWPFIRERLGISYKALAGDYTEWHSYSLRWTRGGCEFFVDSKRIMKTAYTPRGPLGFVCWLDNQYLVARPTGRFRWGTLAVAHDQSLEVADIRISEISSS
jgi:hypothetical protein